MSFKLKSKGKPEAKLDDEREGTAFELTLDVERLPNFELILTANGISARIAA